MGHAPLLLLLGALLAFAEVLRPAEARAAPLPAGAFHPCTPAMLPRASRGAVVPPAEKPPPRDELDLVEAASRDDAGKVRALLAKGVRVDAADTCGVTALMWSATRGNEELASLLIAKGANVDARNKHGCSTLLLAVQNGRLGVTRLLLERGVDVNAANEDGANPITAAVVAGPAMARLLIARGADVNHRNVKGSTPLLMAADRGRADVAAVLLEAGADVNGANSGGWTPLHYAVNGKAYGLVDLLLGKGADVNAQGKGIYADTPLIVAASRGDRHLVRVLLRAGADASRRNHEGRTALEEARKEGRKAVIALLEPA